MPARDEADVIERSLAGLLAQDYPGPFHVVLVDDDSSDGTAARARALPGGDRLSIVTSAPLPQGWVGKIMGAGPGSKRPLGSRRKQLMCC